MVEKVKLVSVVAHEDGKWCVWWWMARGRARGRQALDALDSNLAL